MSVFSQWSRFRRLVWWLGVAVAAVAGGLGAAFMGGATCGCVSTWRVSIQAPAEIVVRYAAERSSAETSSTDRSPAPSALAGRSGGDGAGPVIVGDAEP